jgi:hypothetical protein
MTNYTTRVVLYGDATGADYAKLHREMAARGFTDEITSDTGIVYKMPDAEYDYSGPETAEQVRLKAKAAADAVKPNNNAVFVTQAGVRSWHGLAQVRGVRRA